MARDVTYWKKVITDQISADPNLSVINNTSSVALFNLLAYCVAYCVALLDSIFDLHRSDVENELNTKTSHKLEWYRQKALNFQYGYPLIDETDSYDNTNVSEDDLAASKIIQYAAVTESDDESRLIIKIATTVGGILQPITTGQLAALTNYFKRIKDGGVKITIINYLPDKLYLNLRIFYDPLVLDNLGNNILDGGRPVEDALNNYMKALPFNGELALINLVDALQKVEGLKIPQLDSAQTSFIDPDTSGYGTPIAVDVRVLPESGYFQIVNFTGITYLPYV
jgi:hypothetical protein